MTNPIEHLRARRHDAEPLHQPDVFERSVYVVNEISEASAMVAVRLVDLRTARTSRSIGAMELANNEIGKLLRQASELNRTLAEQIAKHRKNGGSRP